MLEQVNLPISRVPGLAIAYHGCDRSVGEKVIVGQDRISDSTNDYDWLGHGQYFWENNEMRARQWAEDAVKSKKYNVTNPYVVGAIIDLGTCLNLMDSSCIYLLKIAYGNLVATAEARDITLPENKNIGGNSDLLLRRLDCAVIEHLHILAKELFKVEFDTIRGVFLEGSPLYPNAGFRDKTHIQICVVNPKCIIGYFKPL